MRSAFSFRPFSRKQKKVLTWWMGGSPVAHMDGIVADGAVRSGKTLSMALSFVLWAMETFDGQALGMCGKTILSFRRNVLSFLVPMLGSRGFRTAYNRSDNRLEVSRAGRVNFFWLFGGRDERSQDLVQGVTLAGVLFDEVALMPESFVNQATARCSVDGARLWFNCNPEGPMHWFKRGWLDKAEQKRLVYLHFTMDDNLSLSPAVKARYHAMYDGVFRRRYIDGEWAVAEGVIYDMFDPARHVLAQVPTQKAIDPGAGRYVSVDYGTQNATVFLLWEREAEGARRWVCMKEYRHSGRESGRQRTDAEYADDLDAWLPKDSDGKALPVTWVIVDPSAASLIAELKRRGHVVRHADNSVLDGIRLTRTLLGLGEIVFAPGCTGTVAEFGTYAWDAKAAERGEDAPMKEADHCMDALRYFVQTKVRRERKWRDS
jgi:PBSX family phage terminase large subunit